MDLSKLRDGESFSVHIGDLSDNFDLIYFFYRNVFDENANLTVFDQTRDVNIEFDKNYTWRSITNTLLIQKPLDNVVVLLSLTTRGPIYATRQCEMTIIGDTRHKRNSEPKSHISKTSNVPPPTLMQGIEAILFSVFVTFLCMSMVVGIVMVVGLFWFLMCCCCTCGCCCASCCIIVTPLGSV